MLSLIWLLCIIYDLITAIGFEIAKTTSRQPSKFFTKIPFFLNWEEMNILVVDPEFPKRRIPIVMEGNLLCGVFFSKLREKEEN